MTTEGTSNSARKIIHIDMDAFFAAVEQRDFPEYRGKPIIVGGLPHSRGVVATCSYEARKFGIHSAMPSSQAFKLCPQAIFVKPRFEAYREASDIIRMVFSDITELFEPLSLDEAFLDVSSIKLCQGSATLIASEIKQRIKQQTGLVASAGVSYNKFLAKIASDQDKPDGLFLITPAQGPEFVAQLNVAQFHGVGKATQAKMNALGIFTGADLKQYSQQLLQQHFGKAGLHYFNICRAIDHRSVNNQRSRKSIGIETTFQTDLLQKDEIFLQLQQLVIKALQRVSDKKMQASTLTVKIKYQDFEQITRSKTNTTTIRTAQQASDIVYELIKSTEIGRRKVRLLGITLSSLETLNTEPIYHQLDLFKTFCNNSDHP